MSERTISLADPKVDIRLNVSRRARRFTLRLESHGCDAVLTLPPGVPESEVLDFVERQSGWLRSALSARPGLITVEPGATVPVDGVRLPVVLAPGRRNTVRMAEGQLRVSGNAGAGRQIAAWLKLRARDRIVPLATAYAADLGRRINGFSFRDTRSRWGSCASSGRLGFSWRLAMAPPMVQDYVAAHEAAHLVEMNHSAEYWAVLAGLMPDYKRHRVWLKTHGRDLHRYRFAPQG